MCDCISELDKMLIEKHEHNGKKIIQAEFLPYAFIGMKFKNQTIGEAEIILEGKKKKINLPICYAYCP